MYTFISQNLSITSKKLEKIQVLFIAQYTCIKKYAYCTIYVIFIFVVTVPTFSEILHPLYFLDPQLQDKKNVSEIPHVEHSAMQLL